MLTMERMGFDDRDQCFTHIESSTGRVRHFAATRMVRYATCRLPDVPPGVEMISAEWDVNFLKFAMQSRGIDWKHLAAMPAHKISLPVIAVHEHDGTTLTVDGHHRMLLQWQRGDTKQLILRFRPYCWEHYLIDLPRQLSEFLAEDVRTSDHAAR